MSSKFESPVKMLERPQEDVFDMLSQPARLEDYKARLPEDKRDMFTFEDDRIRLSVPPVGDIALRVVDREAPKMIKFEAENSPLPFHFWIQLLPLSETASKMRLTLKADINPLIRAMVSKPLQEGVDKIAETLALAINK